MTQTRRTGPTPSDPLDTNANHLSQRVARRERLRVTWARRRHARELDEHLDVWRARHPEPFSGTNGTELDFEQREQAAGVAA